jgi:hypothetical protein
VTYKTAEALRIALEQRLRTQSQESGINLERLRRRVIFERVVARLEAAEPRQWVLKGGMALEVRLRDDARLTKDIDMGLRGAIAEAAELQERLVEALSADPFGDRFVITVGLVTQLMEDGAGHLTWRTKVAAHLAGRPFGGVQLDVSPRAHELEQTDIVPLPNSLAFAGIDAPSIEIIDVHRHAAEKYHAMLRDFGDRENSRVRDLVDLVILREQGLLDPIALSVAIQQVWLERDVTVPPSWVPPFPVSWPDRYEALAADHDLSTTTFPAAVVVVTTLWAEMFPTEET